MHAEYLLTYMGIFVYKEWKSSHPSATALELLILGATEN